MDEEINMINRQIVNLKKSILKLLIIKHFINSAMPTPQNEYVERDLHHV